MTDISITAANVIPASTATVEGGIAGAALVAGQLVYREAVTNLLKLTDSDGAAALRSVWGMTVNGGAIGQPVSVLRRGNVTLGAIPLVVGKIYVASDTPGGVMPVDDLETGDYVTTIGIAISTTVLAFQVQESGVAVPAP